MKGHSKADPAPAAPPPPFKIFFGGGFGNFDFITRINFIVINMQCLQYVFYSLLLLQKQRVCVKGHQKKFQTSKIIPRWDCAPRFLYFWIRHWHTYAYNYTVHRCRPLQGHPTPISSFIFVPIAIPGYIFFNFCSFTEKKSFVRCHYLLCYQANSICTTCLTSTKKQTKFGMEILTDQKC